MFFFVLFLCFLGRRAPCANLNKSEAEVLEAQHRLRLLVEPGRYSNRVPKLSAGK